MHILLKGWWQWWTEVPFSRMSYLIWLRVVYWIKRHKYNFWKIKKTSWNVKLDLFSELHWFSHEQSPLLQTLIILYFLRLRKKNKWHEKIVIIFNEQKIPKACQTKFNTQKENLNFKLPQKICVENVMVTMVSTKFNGIFIVLFSCRI